MQKYLSVIRLFVLGHISWTDVERCGLCEVMFEIEMWASFICQVLHPFKQTTL